MAGPCWGRAGWLGERITRLWTLHPQYLDSRGLVALWREALLAQAALKGLTHGYARHPQLTRFRLAASPVGSVAAYLQGVHAEAARRGYRFDPARIASPGSCDLIVATQGQLDFEWAHLLEKLPVRAPAWRAGIEPVLRPLPHPLFRIVPGEARSGRWRGRARRCDRCG